MKKQIFYLTGTLILLLALGYLWLTNANNFQRSGTFDLSVNDRPIKIHRDEHGIAYVFADTKADVFRGQGFVLAQDRLFQVEFYRALIRGEAASIVGSAMLDSDIQMRVLDLVGNAKRSMPYFDDETKQVLQWYCEGFNEYLRVGEDEFPLELSLLGMEPQPLKPEDIVSVTHFIGFFHSQNMEDEILSLNLAARMDQAAQLLPLAVNLDRTKPLKFTNDTLPSNSVSSPGLSWQPSPEPLLPYPELGSNNWAVAGHKTSSGKPILSNDPHVDARTLPGTFYPIGLFCPDFQAVGIATPAVPGLTSGRNQYVSFGVTNSYGDSQDLFVEEVTGDFYLQDGKKLPLRKRQATIEIKDSAAVEITIRSTAHGPIISDFPVFNIMTDDVISLRWSLAETQSSTIGFDRLLEARNVFEFMEVLQGMDNNFFNYVLADLEGNIAHQSTGLVPVRKDHQGAVPQVGSQGDSWLSFIPKKELPHTINPNRGWLGTANHDTRPDDYPYFYSNHFSPYYRYQRLSEALATNKKLSANDLWALILDTKNMQAAVLTPLFIKALEQNPATQYQADLLEKWNYHDDIEEVGATIYNVLYNELLYLILDDELPDELEEMYWKNVYYWNQRIDSMILADHAFIDNSNTPERETLSDLIIEAGIKTEALLTEKLGEDPAAWTWGRIHTVYFSSPIRPAGVGSSWLGAELMPKRGSNQTLNRGGFVKNRARKFDTSWFSSFRMVADMDDPDKLMGALSGGSSARVLHPYYKSQLATWQAGTWIPYWISKEKVIEHSAFELVLE